MTRSPNPEVRRSLRSFALLVVLGPLAVGCTLTDDQLPPAPAPAGSNEPEPRPAPDYTKVEQLIGPTGGTIHHPSGAEIVVPEGALGGDGVVLSIEGTSSPSPFDLGGIPM